MSTVPLDILSLLKNASGAPPMASLDEIQSRSSPATDTLRDLMSSVPQYQPSRLDSILGAGASLGNYFGSKDIHGKGMSPAESASAASETMMIPYKNQLANWSARAKVGEELAKTQAENTKTGVEYEKGKATLAGEAEARGETKEHHRAEEAHAETEEELARQTNELKIRELKRSIFQQDREYGLRTQEHQDALNEHEYAAAKPTTQEQAAIDASNGVLPAIDKAIEMINSPNVKAKLSSTGGRLGGLFGKKTLGQVLAGGDPELNPLQALLTTITTSAPAALGSKGMGGGGGKLVDELNKLLNSSSSPDALVPSLTTVRDRIHLSQDAIDTDRATRVQEHRKAMGGGGSKGKPMSVDDLIKALEGGNKQ